MKPAELKLFEFPSMPVVLSSLTTPPRWPPTWQPVQENGTGAAGIARGALTARSAANAGSAAVRARMIVTEVILRVITQIHFNAASRRDTIR
jgi:hypothetical protein